MTLWWPRIDDVQAWLVAEGFHSRDWGLLSSALERPLTTISGQQMYPSLWLKLAALLDSVERNHPLLDGNKRLGYLLLALILQGNDIDEAHVSDDDWYDLIIDSAAHHLELEELARRIEALVTAAPRFSNNDNCTNLSSLSLTNSTTTNFFDRGTMS